MPEENKNQKNGVPSGKSSRPPFRNQESGGRRSRAGIVWLILFLGIGALLLFKNVSGDEVENLPQSHIEKELKKNNPCIISLILTPDGDQVYDVKGTIKEHSGAERKFRSRVVLTENLQKVLPNCPKVTIDTSSSGIWNVFFVSILPVLLLVGVIYFFSARQMRMNGQGAMDFGRSRARMIPPEELNVKFDDVAGAEEAKEEIKEIVDYLKDPIKFQLVGGRIPHGCLLVGEPGTGKTLMAKAVACEAGVPFFSISGSDFVEMFVGVGASRVRDMFEQARKHTPCLIFIDEIDAVGRSRFSGWGGGHDEREQTLNAMLVEMDGLESQPGVIVLAATNRPDVLDPALLRPGRFDRRVVMDLPDINGRKQILNVHVKKIKVDASVDVDVLARTTPGFSGADLANLCNEAALLAARREHESVSQAEMEEARDKVSYGTERRSRKIVDRERRLTAYHESGHALVALFNEYCTPVHKVTIIPRGQAYLGATFTMPKEDVYTKSKLELEAEMAMAMGGRAAEELVMGDVTTGASADIAHMSGIARRMVTIFGMSESIGPVKCADYPAHPHVRVDMPPEDLCSQETAREIDLEIRRIVKQAHDAALECLKAHRDDLEKMALALLERETLSIEEIRELLGLTPPPRPPEEAPTAETTAAEAPAEGAPVSETAAV